MPSCKLKLTQYRTREAADCACHIQRHVFIVPTSSADPINANYNQLILLASSTYFRRDHIILNNHHWVIELCSFYSRLHSSQSSRKNIFCINVLREVYSFHFLKILFLWSIISVCKSSKQVIFMCLSKRDRQNEIKEHHLFHAISKEPTRIP